jgi:hypothetical protein
MTTRDWSEEIRFAKAQQWRIATAALTLLAAIFAIAHTMRPLACWEKAAATVFAVLVAAAGSLFLIMLQNHLADTRRRIDHDEAEAWHREGSILAALVGTVIIGAIVVGYSLWRD